MSALAGSNRNQGTDNAKVPDRRSLRASLVRHRANAVVGANGSNERSLAGACRNRAGCIGLTQPSRRTRWRLHARDPDHRC